MFGSCEIDRYTLSSPKKDRCLTVEFTYDLSTGPKYVKLYYGIPGMNSKEFALIRWSDIGGFAVDWASHPLKIRSYSLTENHIPDSLVDFQLHLTPEEEKDFKKSGNWISYDFNWIINDKYESCTK